MFGEVMTASLSVKAQSFRSACASTAVSKAAKNKRFYAVHYGKIKDEVIKDFITESWVQCRRLVEGVSGSIYKSFFSHGKAREFLIEQKQFDLLRSGERVKGNAPQEPPSKSTGFKPKAPFSLSEPQPIISAAVHPATEPRYRRGVDLDDRGEVERRPKLS
jgi:hypothetical protein